MLELKVFQKTLLCEEIETIIYQLFEEIQLSYEKQPEQLVAKVIIRVKKKDTQITYIG